MGRHHHTKPDIVIPVVRIVVVAIRTAHVPLIIVERAAAQHTDDVFGLPRRIVPAFEIIYCFVSCASRLIVFLFPRS